MKECLKELESSLRRRKGGEATLASEVEAYIVSRKQINKTNRKCFRNLKSVEKNCTSAALEKDSNMVLVVVMLRKTKEISLAIFQSLVSLISQAKARSNTGGWAIVSKLFQPKLAASEGEASELEKMDAELLVLKSSRDISLEQVQNILKGLEAVESSVKEAEEDGVHRKLLKTRVSILNVINH